MDSYPASAVSTFLRRLVGAAALNRAVYEEVEADSRATAEAVAVVALSGLAAGIGARGFGGGQPMAIVFFTILALTAWAAWALLTYQIGVRILSERQTEATAGQMVRTLGFATAPGMLRVLGVVPGVTTPIFVITAVWMLVAMIVALQQALDYASARRAIAVCVLGWLLVGAFAMVFGLLFGPSVS